MSLVLSCRNLFCYRNNCCGIRLEHVCLIFATFNVFLVALFLAECLYFIAWLMVVQRNVDIEGFFFDLMYGVGLTVGSMICLFFAVLLCYGIIRKKRSYIKSYFIFGVVVEVLALLSILAFICDDNLDEEQQFASYAALIICGVYPFLLLVLRRTYRGMNKIVNDDSQQKLSHYTNLNN